jgi:menaquinone-dependent protoporphyrinogen oxidase
MRVLVTYASRHGATAGIAERIAQVIERRGLEVTLLAADRARDTDGYAAFVVGSAAYMNRWLGDAISFVRRHQGVLAANPTWLFSSGPIGTEHIDKKGRDVLVASEPVQFEEYRRTVRPRDTRVFFGAYDPNAKPVGLAERFTALLPASIRQQIPAGDFRDWADIDAWASSIADQLDADVSRPEPLAPVRGVPV